MDIQTLAAAIGVAKSIPGSAAERAEAAAALAQEYGYSLVFSDGYMVIGEQQETEN